MKVEHRTSDDETSEGPSSTSYRASMHLMLPLLTMGDITACAAVSAIFHGGLGYRWEE